MVAAVLEMRVNGQNLIFLQISYAAIFSSGFILSNKGTQNSYSFPRNASCYQNLIIFYDWGVAESIYV